MKNRIADLAKRLRRGSEPKRFQARGLRSQLSKTVTPPPSGTPLRSENPLEVFFDSLREGPGVWKWRHYFEIYDRHFRKFRGKPVNILEIGIYSGGSLEMWREYFGPLCRIYGVDIEPACKSYENEFVKVFIGDQANRTFWESFRSEVGGIDILIDDGGHEPEQQIVTLEEMLPFMRPGGVYLCEDVVEEANGFAAYVRGLTTHLNAFEHFENNSDNPERRLVTKPTLLQAAIDSIHIYPFVVAIEKRDSALNEFVAPKHGTQWQPFLS
jgi:hypothetical protein